MHHVREELEASGTRRSSRFPTLVASLVLLAIGLAGCVEVGPLPPDSFVLTLAISGDGAGTIGIARGDCADSCSFAVEAYLTIVVTVVPSAGSELDAWSGCDEVAGLECTVTVNSNRDVTATLSLSEIAPEEPGEVAITFSGLPEGVQNLGHATITFPNGDEVPVFETTVLRDVPAGEYRVTPHSVDVCDTVQHPDAPARTLQVQSGERTELRIAYGPPALTTQAFKAVVTGIHSNASPVNAYIAVTEAAPLVMVVACVTSNDSAGANNPSIRRGNPKDALVDDAPIVAALSPAEQSCSGTPEARSCTVYLGGVLELTSAELDSFRAGDFYFYAEYRLSHGEKLVAQIGSEDYELVPAIGGTLALDIQNVPAEFANLEVCIVGHFDLGWMSYGGNGPCVPLSEAGVTEYPDIYSGDYEADIHLRWPVTELPAGLQVLGSPATVRSGSVTTISVVYEEPD